MTEPAAEPRHTPVSHLTFPLPTVCRLPCPSSYSLKDLNQVFSRNEKESSWQHQPGVVTHIWVAVASRLLKVQGQPVLHSESQPHFLKSMETSDVTIIYWGSSSDLSMRKPSSSWTLPLTSLSMWARQSLSAAILSFFSKYPLSYVPKGTAIKKITDCRGSLSN